jgi:hypothetical protein
MRHIKESVEELFAVSMLKGCPSLMESGAEGQVPTKRKGRLLC